MTELKDLTPGTLVKGVTSDTPVEVVSVKWFGDSAIELIYKVPATGAVGNQLVYRDDAVSLDIVEQGLPWSSRGENMKSLPKVPTTRLDDLLRCVLLSWHFAPFRVRPTLTFGLDRISGGRSHDPSFNHNLPRFGCLPGTFSPSPSPYPLHSLVVHSPNLISE